jgi:PTH1 family peptidyl-tRNA hydrolase
MKAIVGLGNPGAEYLGTRHNVGFDVVDELVRRWNVRLKSWKSVAALAVVPGHDALLAAPKTFMNASGQAVQAVAAFYHLEPSDVLIVVDDVNLPLGRLRLRPSGSAGGHNGLKSVIEQIGAGFPRLRIGVDRGDPARDLSDRVLSRFQPGERDIVNRAIARAADAVETFVDDGCDAAMNRYNAPSDGGTGESDIR